MTILTLTLLLLYLIPIAFYKARFNWLWANFTAVSLAVAWMDWRPKPYWFTGDEPQSRDSMTYLNYCWLWWVFPQEERT